MSSIKYCFTIVLLSILFLGCASRPEPSKKMEVSNFQSELKEYSKYKEYHNAIAENSLDNLKNLLKNNPIDINMKIHPRGSLLYIAVRGIQENSNDIVRYEIIKYLIEEKHADINTKINGGWTPLNAASSGGLLEIVKYLVEKGADIEFKNLDGMSPLYSSSLNGHSNVVKYLLEKGANIESVNNTGWTPLNAASANGYLDIVKYLVEKGANIESKNSDSMSPLYSASLKGHLDIVKYLLEKGADIESKAKGWSPLNAAAFENKLNIVKYLVEKGADIESKNTGGWTPLNAAACNKNRLEVVKYFVENGANIESKSNDNWTPLHAAASNNNEEIVKYLIENGANPFRLVNTPNYVANYNINALLQYAQQNYTTLKASAEERISANMQKKRVDEYISKQDFISLKAYTDEYPNAVYYIPQIELRLMLTGPKGMKIGDIIKMIEKGRSETIILAMIRGVKSPYKEFSIDEIDLLVKMGLSDAIIAKIIDTTTDILKDKQKKAEQDKFLLEQSKIAKEGAATKVIYQNAPQNQQNNSDDIIDVIGKEAAKQGVKMLLDRLF
jgi:ankyrin repeat protein